MKINDSAAYPKTGLKNFSSVSEMSQALHFHLVSEATPWEKLFFSLIARLTTAEIQESIQKFESNKLPI